MELLDACKLDVVIGRVPTASGGYRFRPLADEAPAVIYAMRHPLHGLAQITFAQLRDCAWTLPPPCNPLCDVVTAVFDQHRATLPDGLETSSTMITIHPITRTRMLAVWPAK